MSLRMDSSRTHLASRETEWNSWWERRNRTEKQLLVTLFVFAIICLALVITVAVLATNRTPQTQPDKNDKFTDICTTAECVRAAQILLDSMNFTINPCEDFYTFTCDGWRNKHKLPEDKGRFSAFDALDEEISHLLRDLLLTPITKDEPSAVAKVKNMYKSCINQENMFNLTLPQVEEVLRNLGNWPLITDNWSEGGFNWLRNEAQFKKTPATPIGDPSTFISLEVYFSENDTSINTIRLDQPALGLGRDFLINPANYSTQIAAYKTLITNVAKFLAKNSDTDISKQVEDIVGLETKLANIMMSPTQKRTQQFHVSMTLEDLQKAAGSEVDWLTFITLIFEDITTIEKTEYVFLMDQPYLYNFSKVIEETDNRTLANYQLWRYILPLLIHLSPQTQSYAYEFSMKMTGVKKPPERWEVCLHEVDKAFSKALGQIFVREHFPSESKTQANEMIREIQDAFINNLKTVEWMDKETKAAAIDKAKNIIHNVGYPEWILDSTKLDDYYKEVNIHIQDYFKNLKNTAAAIAKEDLKSLRQQPVDKSKWYMSPNTVNAYYVPELNSITFPAGILQSPFYKAGRPMAMNFGGIGSVIGHEITHGFDDEGRKYDKTGALKSWWTQYSIDNFQKRSQCYAKQYEEYCPAELPNICVNGNNTLGENIADNGGLKAAYIAYKKWEQNNQPEKRLPGLEQYSTDQLFFITFGQLWCSNWRKETLLHLILKDPHSPVQYRVLGTLTNSEEFAAAFKCPQTSRKKCQLW
uniref:Endothelin-converting enzyme 1 n=1 Tax=Strigamia maritima TaxID=126957 RepID=T1IL64_STRMM